MTARLPFSPVAVRKAIQAARAAGLYVLAIRPDGVVIVGDEPIDKATLAPPAPDSLDEAERKRWQDLKL